MHNLTQSTEKNVQVNVLKQANVLQSNLYHHYTYLSLADIKFAVSEVGKRSRTLQDLIRVIAILSSVLKALYLVILISSQLHMQQ